MESKKRLNTKLKFANALESLLKRKNMDEIQVNEIINLTGISRKTFYRHFTDKYDLAEWYFKQFFDNSFGMIIQGEDWDSAMINYLDFCASKSDVLCHAYSSNDVNGLRECDISITQKTYEKYLQEQGACISEPEMQFAIEIAARGGTDMVIKWLLDGMKEDKKQLMKLIKKTLPTDILKYLQNDT